VNQIEIDLRFGNLQTTKTEDSFLRLFEVVYKFKNLHNLTYDKINTEGIDLIERNENLGIQITAQQTHESDKINETIKKTLKAWKDKGVKTLWIFFIVETSYLKKIDTTIEYYSEDDFKVYIKTVRRIIGDINKQSIEERIKIDEFLKQDTSKIYHGISNLSAFEQIEKGKKFGNDRFLNIEDCIYFSERENETLDYQSKRINSGELKEYCILGNPCSGKTTFAYSLIQKIERRKVFYLNLSHPNINLDKIINELTQISYHYSIVVIDNIQDNIEVFKRIRVHILKHKCIVSLYLSRYYKTFDSFDFENIYKIIEGIQYYRIELNENFEDKFSGIIGLKIKRLISINPLIKWYKGDFDKIIKNTNKNLLKLNIALRYWEKINSVENPIKFDSIVSSRILQEFYAEQKLSSFHNDLTYTYCLLYKNDIAFIPFRDDDTIDLLKEKGVILQFYKSDFCYFQHKEYAQLIFDAFEYREYGKTEDNKAALIIKYINAFDIAENQLNIYFILTKFYKSATDKYIVPYLLSYAKVANYLINEISDFNIIQACILANILFDFSESISAEYLKQYYNSLINYFSSTKLNLYIFEQYFAYSRLLQISNQLGIKLEDNKISNVYSGKEYSKKSSISYLTLEVSKRSRTPQNVLQILNSFQFPDWFNMITQKFELPSITNSLSELNKSSESKKLLIGLMRNIDWDQLYLKSKELKIDQIAKSLRELQKIDISVGLNVSSTIFEKSLKDNFLQNKLHNASLSEYSKALSDLSNINPAYVRTQIEEDIKNGQFKHKFTQEKSISNFTMRGLEMKKLVEDKYLYFKTLNEIAIGDSFVKLIENEMSFNTILCFCEFKNDFLKRKNHKQEIAIQKTISRIIKNSPDKLELLKNPKILKLKNINSDFIQSISSKEIEDYINNNKITYAEDILRVLSTLNKKKTIEIFSKVDNSILVKKLLFHELNFSQSLELLQKIRNKVFLDEIVNCNLKISQILDEYLESYLKTGNRFRNITVSDFFKGYYQAYCINPVVIEKHLKTTFLEKLNSDNHKGFEIGPLFQYTRRISDITNHMYDKELKNFLNINMLNFQQSIKNEEITKTLSGMIELSHAEFSDFSDELLFKSKTIIISKVIQRKKEIIYMTKLLPDIKKIAKNKGKIVLKELKA